MASGNIYGKVNIPSVGAGYTGVTTETTNTVVDNDERTIAVNVDLMAVQEKLRSGENIKTIAGESVLGEGQTFSSYKLYSCKLYDNGTLIRHFIPCFRKSDNEIGLFDLVNQVFYANNGTGTFLKGANVNSVSDLSFSYQGSGVGTSHDSVEKTATEWVFTKNNFNYSFTGNEIWAYDSTNQFFGCNLSTIGMKLPSSTTNKTNSLIGLLLNDTESNARTDTSKNMTYFITTAGYIGIRNTSITDLASFKSWIANQVFQFELATPQVIRIPLKHLRVVDMGTLSWTYISSENRFLASVSGIKQVSARTNDIYCEKYINDIGGFDMTKTGIIYHYLGGIYIQDKNYTNATDFTNAMKGQYLFYETQDEVADIDLTMNSEVGGELNSYDFKWIRNQQIANGNFVDTSGWNTTNCSTTASNNELTITKTGSPSNYTQAYRYAYGTKVGHKYLVFAHYTASTNTGWVYLRFGSTTNSPTAQLTANTKTLMAGIKELTSSDINANGNTEFNFFTLANAMNTNDTLIVENANCVDLTQAFGSGNEPTSTSDPRIQRIIKLGYIPTDINGTLTYEETEVLPNVDVKEKAK